MLERTDTKHAPWHVIASDDKQQARLRGLKIMVEEIGRGVKIIEPELDPEIAEAALKMWGWKDKDSRDKK